MNDILVKIGADVSSFSRNLSKVSDDLNQLGRDSKTSNISLGKLAASIGAVAIATKGISMIKDSFTSAFSRIDTMEQFERVMSTMTGSTEKAGQVLTEITDTVIGTAYGLDIGAKAVQDFVTSNMDVDKATKTFASWGDAVAFYGDGSNQTIASVSDALAKMVAKGKVQMDTMNRLTEAGIPAMQIFADATGQSVEEVAQQMQKGELDAGKFTDIMNDALTNGTKNFEGIAGAAKEAGSSWGASFDNMRAAVTRGVVKIVQSIDEMLTSNGFPAMREIVADFGKKFESVLSKAAEAIPALVEKIKEVLQALEPWLPAIKAIVVGIGTFVTVVATVNTLKNAFLTLRSGILAVNAAVLANPFAAVLAIIIAAASLVYVYWEPISGFFLNLWESIKEIFTAIWDPITEVWTTVVDNFMSIFSPIIDFFSSALEIISGLFSDSWNALSDFLAGTWDNIQTTASAAWDLIKNIILGPILLLINLITGDFDELKANLKAIWGNIKDAAGRIWGALKDQVANLMSVLGSILSNLWNGMKQIASNAWNAMKSTASNVWGAIKNIGSNIWNGIKNTISNLASKAKDGAIKAWNTLKEKTSQAFKKVVEFIKNPLKGIDLFSIGADIIKGLIGGIGSMAKAVWDKAKSIGRGIADGIKGMLGIKSPSRVMMAVGKFTGQGLEKGILGMRKAVAKASEKLAESATINPKSVQLSYSTPNGIKSSLTSAVNGSVAVNATGNRDVLENIHRELKDQRQIIVEMDGREVGEIVSPVVSEYIDESASRISRGRGRRRI